MFKIRQFIKENLGDGPTVREITLAVESARKWYQKALDHYNKELIDDNQDHKSVANVHFRTYSNEYPEYCTPEWNPITRSFIFHLYDTNPIIKDDIAGTFVLIDRRTKIIDSSYSRSYLKDKSFMSTLHNNLKFKKIVNNKFGAFRPLTDKEINSAAI